MTGQVRCKTRTSHMRGHSSPRRRRLARRQYAAPDHNPGSRRLHGLSSQPQGQQSARQEPNVDREGAFMVARVNTVAFRGIDVVDVDAQVQMAAGLPAFTKVEN